MKYRGKKTPKTPLSRNLQTHCCLQESLHSDPLDETQLLTEKWAESRMQNSETREDSDLRVKGPEEQDIS